MSNIDNSLQYLLILFAILAFLIYNQKEKFRGVAAAVATLACGGCKSIWGTCCPRGCNWYGGCA